MSRQKGYYDQRFIGMGNVQVFADSRKRGWQLTCCECGKLSDVVYRTGDSYPPHIIQRIFRDKGWKVHNKPSKDICPECLVKLREQRRQDRKQYVDGAVDRMIELIRALDRFMSNAVATDFSERQPEIAAQMKSLFETAYLCNMYVPDEPKPELKPEPKSDPVKGLGPEPFKNFFAEEPRFYTLEETWNFSGAEERSKFLAQHPVVITPKPEPELPGPEPETFPLPEPKPEPITIKAPPQPNAQHMSARTAAFLAEIRKEVFKEEARR